MSAQPKVLTFDVDSESDAALQQAFPHGDIEALDGISTASLIGQRSLVTADLLVIGARADVAEILGLCRELRSQINHAQTPMLVLVFPEHHALVRAALAAGAHSCLVLPVHAKDLVSMVARAHAGNRPGHHTLSLDRAQRLSPWQDDGGEG